MKVNTTELVFILDRSGSMAGLEKDTIGGFNAMIEKQRRQPGRAMVTTVLFDNRVETIHDRLPLDRVPEMTEEQYYVLGCTALLDAVGETVEHIRTIHKYARPEDVPEKTVFVITTDGLENASSQYTYGRVRDLIEEQRESRGWEFLFLGANIDAVAEGMRFGIDPSRAVNYCCDPAGTTLNYEVVGVAVKALRAGAPLQASWKSRIEEDCKRRGRRR